MDNDVYFLWMAAKSARADMLSLVAKQDSLFENVLAETRVFRKNAGLGPEVGAK